MNRDDIIRMARESGMRFHKEAPTEIEYFYVYPDALEHFANLIAAAEREACASICDAEAKEWVEMRAWADDFANELAAAIRARGKE